jgi:hypothetical protein
MTELFFSYSHRDEDLRNELETHLSSLQRQGLISGWHDRRIQAGKNLDTEISDGLERAGIILLLVSPYFIGSDYCYGIEMNRAMERHHAGSARVIPVILEPCDWHDLPFGKLNAVPKDGRPISKFPNLHDAFLEVTLAIKAVVKSLGSGEVAAKYSRGKKTPATPSVIPVSSTPRSSNLRVKREFTEREKDKFLQGTFEYIANYFEASLQELDARNADIEADFRRIDANHFSASIYKNGKKESSCKIWLSGRGGFGDGIAYSIGEHSGGNSLNDLLTVKDDGNILYLETYMSFGGRRQDGNMTMEGGAEYYWGRFIEPLQR